MNDLPLLEHVRASLPTLTDSARRVAEGVLASPASVPAMSAARLAERTGSSVGSVVRFCHAIGFPGFQDFKDRLAGETSAPRIAREPDGAADEILHDTLVGMARAQDALDMRAIERAAGVVHAARRILIAGVGPSLPMTMAFGQALNYRGYAPSYPADAESQTALAGVLTADDVCVAISHSGTSPTTVAPARIARERGAGVVALTSFAGTPLAQTADVVIVAGAPADAHRSADQASRPLHLTVLHAVLACLPHAS